jgi:hypothetical protein
MDATTDTCSLLVGMPVYWVDPDGGLGSGAGRIFAIGKPDDEELNDGTVITLAMDDGGRVEALAPELHAAEVVQD